MTDLKRVSLAAVVALVVLRIAVGWQFFYEGLWKYSTIGTANEWSAAGYLKNARGPFRNLYRGQLDDPDDLNWLDDDKVSKRWDNWQERFAAFHELTDKQKQQLDRLLNGPDRFVADQQFRLPKKPDDRILQMDLVDQNSSIASFLDSHNHIRLEQVSDDETAPWQLVVDGERHMTPAERSRLLRRVRTAEYFVRQQAAATDDDATKAYWQEQRALFSQLGAAVTDVFKTNQQLSFKERLKATLAGDPELAGRVHKDEDGTVVEERIGKVQEYKRRIKRRNAMLSGAETDFQWDHLQKEEKRIRELHAEVVGPVKSLESQLHRDARDMLTAKQAAQGYVAAAPPGRIDTINALTMWSLMILGVLLIVGLLSRTAAVLGGLLVLSFYLAMPPWPGVPQPPGPEHSLFINKNLLEVLALFALAAVPTGKFFGIDAVFIGCCRRKTKVGSPDNGRQQGTDTPSSQYRSSSAMSSSQQPVAETPESTTPAEEPATTTAGTQTSNPEAADVYAVKQEKSEN